MALITTSELAKLLNVSVNTARRRAKRGDYPFYKGERPQGPVYLVEVPDEVAARLRDPAEQSAEQRAAPTASTTRAPRKTRTASTPPTVAEPGMSLMPAVVVIGIAVTIAGIVVFFGPSIGAAIGAFFSDVGTFTKGVAESLMTFLAGLLALLVVLKLLSMLFEDIRL